MDDSIRDALRRKLDPAHVKPAPRGKYGDYVDGYHVVSEANRIFGEEGWSYEVTRLEKVSEQTVETQKGPQYRVGYLCAVRVHVLVLGERSFKEGVAVGTGVGSPNTIADHHESAVKEAETDALKRALRTYGNTFGLALYDKEKAQVGIDLPPFNHVAALSRIMASVEKQTDIDDLRALWRTEAETLADIRAADKASHASAERAFVAKAAALKRAAKAGEPFPDDPVDFSPEVAQ